MELEVQQLPPSSSKLCAGNLCIVNVPAYLIPTDLLRFLAGSLRLMSTVRVVFNKETSQYLALIALFDETDAQSVLSAYDGIRFTSLDDCVCEVRPVQFPAAAHESEEATTQGHGATDSCAVCLEAVDGPLRRSIFVPCCGHRLHADCASRLESSVCPVCRFQHDGDDSVYSSCASCGWTGVGGDDDDLWVCLVCGSVGCGALRGDCIRSHYRDTLHTYAVNTSTNAVYDFAGEGVG
jgi:BRCA1-associated protein